MPQSAKPLTTPAETAGPAPRAPEGDNAETLFAEAAKLHGAGRLAKAEALVVRSATQVDSGLLAAAEALKAVGRAGVGIDSGNDILNAHID